MKRTMCACYLAKVVRVEADSEFFLTVRWISGVCFGIEFLWNHNMMVVDVGIVRIYVGIRERN